MSRAQQLALSIYRVRHPESRAVTTGRYVRNGASQAQRACVLCGALFPSWCSKWPQTKRASLAEMEHDCAEDYIRRTVGCL